MLGEKAVRIDPGTSLPTTLEFRSSLIKAQYAYCDNASVVRRLGVSTMFENMAERHKIRTGREARVETSPLPTIGVNEFDPKMPVIKGSEDCTVRYYWESVEQPGEEHSVSVKVSGNTVSVDNGIALESPLIPTQEATLERIQALLLSA